MQAESEHQSAVAEVRATLDHIEAGAPALAGRIVAAIKAATSALIDPKRTRREPPAPPTTERRPYAFTHAGREYRFAPFGEKHRAAFERWVRTRALETLDRLRPDMTPADFAGAESSLLRDLVAGRYDLEGPVCREAMTTTAGTLALASMLLNVTAAEVRALAVAEGAGGHLARGLALSLGVPTPRTPEDAAHGEAR